MTEPKLPNAPPLVPAFVHRQNESSIIGRMLAGYGELEFVFCRLLGTALGDRDLGFRAMFGQRGEKRRIDIADEMLRPKMQMVDLDDLYSYVIDGLHYCRELRNQYAHCHWSEYVPFGLVFVNLEDITKETQEIFHGESIMLPARPVDEQLLAEQENFFSHVDLGINYLDREYRCRTKQLEMHVWPVPVPTKKPPKWLRAHVAPSNRPPT